MTPISIKRLVRLYIVPEENEFPAIRSVSLLKQIIQRAGKDFPLIQTRAYLTHIHPNADKAVLSEKDGDIHFYIEGLEDADDPKIAMLTCEIQGMAKTKNTNEDQRTNFIRSLAGREVEVVGVFRAWPEHLRDSTQPHLFEIHPVLKIGPPGKTQSFLDRVIWPTGEDPEEKTRSFQTVISMPKGVLLKRKGDELVFTKKTFKKENYVHIAGFYAGDGQVTGPGFAFTLRQSESSQKELPCLSLKGTASFDTVRKMKPGHYEIGGLCGLDLRALIEDTPQWKAELCPVLSAKKLS